MLTLQIGNMGIIGVNSCRSQVALRSLSEHILLFNKDGSGLRKYKPFLKIFFL